MNKCEKVEVRESEKMKSEKEKKRIGLGYKLCYPCTRKKNGVFASLVLKSYL